MLIREATATDAEQIISHVERIAAEPNRMIARAPGEFQYTPEQERQILAEHAAAENSIYLVAEVENRIIGVLNCKGGMRQATRQTASIGISVDAQWRGQGIGTALMRRLLEWAQSSAVLHRIELEVYAHNATAIRLYQKFGFVEEGRRREAYFLNEGFVDGVLMARLL